MLVQLNQVTPRLWHVFDASKGSGSNLPRATVLFGQASISVVNDCAIPEVTDLGVGEVLTNLDFSATAEPPTGGMVLIWHTINTVVSKQKD